VIRNVLLGAALVIFGATGVTIGVVRLAGGRDAVSWAVAAAAALAGTAAFGAVVRAGRRGLGDLGRWLILPALAAAFFLDRLPDRWQLALLAAAGGYIAAFVGYVTIRAVRLTR
jgi:hypothetical protein